MNKFKDKIDGNLVTVEKVEGDELHLLKKQFSQDTGEEIDPISDTFLKSTLLINKAELEAKLAEINEMLKEFDGKEE